MNIIKAKQNKAVKKLYLYTIPKESQFYKESKGLIEKATNLKVEISALNDKAIHDPEGRAKKAKPGKPAIFLE